MCRENNSFLQRITQMIKIYKFDEEKVEKAIEEFIKKLSKDANVLKIVIFGSFVRGDYAPGSDVDFLIILRNSDKKFVDRIPDFIPQNFPVDVDVFPYTLEEIEKMKKSGNTFIKRIFKEGKVLFEREIT